MHKDLIRDYVTEAFRLYAALQRPTYEAACDMVRSRTKERYAYTDPETAAIQAEKTVNDAAPFLLDILAVERTLDMLEIGGKHHIVKAVEAVYFVKPSSKLTRGELTERVRWYSLTVPTDERTVYRWLKEARLLCASVRNLRITSNSQTLARLQDVSSAT